MKESFKLYLTLLFSISFLGSYAQLHCPNPFGVKATSGYLQNHISFGVGYTDLKGDINKTNEALGFSYQLGYDRMIGRGIYLGTEIQKGDLTIVPQNYDPRQLDNDYFSIGLRAKIAPFQLLMIEQRRASITQRFLEGIYVGVGAAHVSNKYTSVYRDLDNVSTYGPIAGYDENGDPVFKDKTKSIILPRIDLGYEMPLRITLNRNGAYLSAYINVQFNSANNDYLDGYVPESVGNSNNDTYRLYSAGLKYGF